MYGAFFVKEFAERQTFCLSSVSLFDLKARFFVPTRGSLTSSRAEVRMECLPGSTLPDELRNAVYDVGDLGDGERILATAIVERFTTRGDGELQPLVEGSPSRSHRPGSMPASSGCAATPSACLDQRSCPDPPVGHEKFRMGGTGLA